MSPEELYALMQSEGFVPAPKEEAPLVDLRAPKTLSKKAAPPSTFNPMTDGAEPPQRQPKPLTLEEKVQAAWEESQSQNRTSLGDLKERLNQYLNIKSGPDLSPLLALSDQWSGGNLSKNYKAPESVEEKALNAIKLQDLISQRESGMSKEQLEFLKAQLRERNSETNSRQDRFETGQTRKSDEYIDKFVGDIEKAAADEAKTFNVMDSAFNSGSYAQIVSSLANYARSVSGEKGVLTDQDIARIMPRNYQGGVAKFLSYFNEIPTSELPADFTTELQSLLNKAKNETSKKYADRLSQKRARLTKLPTYSNTMKEYGSNVFEDAEGNIKNAFAVGKSQGAPSSQGVPKKMYSPSRNQTKIIYPDGREEVVDGRQ